eukprot:CAMPEP_0194054722 /NCGR_PEP_ID=MMETSP0009_2-20130614/54357_1 /TAXON_ID=210454 /ORGANISM="Grammatophora oceanica, Strain CCMP 410" /LENGTH=54 /DNA_ID=CAMNT_0038703333 /DNA_START=50 /DNA_END=214 /DNA_ORIENTATION=-
MYPVLLSNEYLPSEEYETSVRSTMVFEILKARPTLVSDSSTTDAASPRKKRRTV